MNSRKKSVWRTVMTARSAWVLTLATIFFVLLSLGQGASASTVLTYDNFSSGTIDSTKWKAGGTTGFLDVQTSSLNSPSNYVLHAAGYGDISYDRAKLVTRDTFSGYFGAGLTFFNFTHSGYLTPSGTANPNPSINLVIGDWNSIGVATNPYFLIARAVDSAGDNIIGWREYSADGSTVIAGNHIDYSGTSGGLELNYNPTTHELQLGYFASTDTSMWSTLDPTTLTTLTGVNFSGAPRLMISFAPGGISAAGNPSYVSTDVGGLYYASLTSHVPLPSSLLLLAPGLAGLAAVRRRFKK